MTDWYDYSNSSSAYFVDYHHNADESGADYGRVTEYSYGPYGQRRNPGGAAAAGGGAGGRGYSPDNAGGYDEFGWKINSGTSSSSNATGSGGKRGAGRSSRGGAGQKRVFGTATPGFTNYPQPPVAKKKKIITKPSNCSMCDVILNSPQQAEQHYNGKNHLKALRKRGLPITPENTPGFTGTIEFVPPKIEDLPPAIETAPPGGGGGGDQQTRGASSTDPVTQAVINNALGKLPTKKKKEVRCDVCHITLTSQVHADSHFSGVKHAKKVVALRKLEELGENNDGSVVMGSKTFIRGGIINQMTQDSDAAPTTVSKKQPITQQNTNIATTAKLTSNNLPDGQSTASMHYCSFCNLYLNSAQQLEAHDAGQKHRNQVKKAELAQLQASNPVSVKPVRNIKREFVCDDCNFEFKTDELLQQHFMSQLHQKKIHENSAAIQT
ncbi:zinc finger protein 385B-like [Tubulanus polymorphus]|uniref:zinc finger protein 385B-like n=1 Tax=Tubulanus polymorphus TaxID=672921 RepID=UPI003DA33666